MKRLTLRVPDELHKRLCDAAHAQGVSENTLILERLSWRHDVMTSSERNEEKEQREKNQKREENKEAKKDSLSSRAREAFKIPTLADCEAYAAEAKLAMDIAQFYDHFTSNGWKVSGRAPMKDWRAAMRNWARRERAQIFGSLTPRSPDAHLKSWREREADAREAAEEARQMRRLESLNALLA